MLNQPIEKEKSKYYVMLDALKEQRAKIQQIFNDHQKEYFISTGYKSLQRDDL